MRVFVKIEKKKKRNRKVELKTDKSGTQNKITKILFCSRFLSFVGTTKLTPKKKAMCLMFVADAEKAVCIKTKTNIISFISFHCSINDGQIIEININSR